MILPIAFGCVLLVISGALFAWWYWHGRVSPNEQGNSTAHHYLAQQSRRRFHVNAIVGLCGIAFIIIPFLDSVGASLVGLLAIIMVIRMLHLAVVDMASTQKFILHSQLEQMNEVKDLQAEVEKFRAEQNKGERNGRGENG